MSFQKRPQEDGREDKGGRTLHAGLGEPTGARTSRPSVFPQRARSPALHQGPNLGPGQQSKVVQPVSPTPPGPVCPAALCGLRKDTLLPAVMATDRRPLSRPLPQRQPTRVELDQAELTNPSSRTEWIILEEAAVSCKVWGWVQASQRAVQSFRLGLTVGTSTWSGVAGSHAVIPWRPKVSRVDSCRKAVSMTPGLARVVLAAVTNSTPAQ